jgi:membrane-associated phospholipid phosphatase
LQVYKVCMKKHIFSLLFLTVLFQYGYCQQMDSSIVLPRYRFSVRQLNVPVTLGLMGIFANSNGKESIKNEIVEARNQRLPHFKTHIDNYLQYSPIAIAYGLDAFGVKSKNDFANRTAILVKGELMMYGAVTLLKNSTHQLRPDGSDYSSFPSGHTAQAFAAATFLSMEYKDRFPWMPYAAYGLASSVGMMRMANNRHYISDVLLGAGIGILSMKASYWTHQYKWGKKKREKMIY